MSVTLSTLNSNDFIIGALAARVTGSETITYGAGFINIGSQVSIDPINEAAEYAVATTKQTALSVSFSTSKTADWAMIGDAVQQAQTSIVQNTDFFVQTLTGSFAIAPGSSAFLCSPAVPTVTSVYSGSWMTDFWASATSAGVLSVTFSASDSSNNIVASAASGTTGTIGTSKSEVKTAFTGSQISVPTGGRLIANITNPTGSGITFTIYWGPGQTTNFQTPADYDYILTLTNSASSPYSVSLSTYSSSAITRILNMTLSAYSPSTQEIIVTNGALTQSSGPTLTLPAGSTLYVRLYATANAFGNSNIIVLIKATPAAGPFFNDAMNLLLN